MKYVVLVSHGTFAPGLKSVLAMLAGGEREDVISVGLECRYICRKIPGSNQWNQR